jgi:hypothetical protein
MEQYKIQDDSGDRNYFTIIPNYILNHSTSNDQSLYLQMKRLAGEKGKCTAGIRYFMKQLGVGQKSIQKSIKYLIEHKWIDFLGKEKIMTNSGYQKINTYKVNDIWKVNNDFYNDIGVSKRIHLDTKNDTRCIQKEVQGVSESIQKKEHNTKKELNTTIVEQPEVANINKIFDILYKINPSLNYAISSHRKATEWLISKYGFEKTVGLAEYAVSIFGKDYAPSITNPSELKSKLSKLAEFAKKNKKNNYIKI